jgi:hypothetical protein
MKKFTKENVKLAIVKHKNEVLHEKVTKLSNKVHALA